MRSLRILPALLFLLLLGGCVFPSGDELLAAPKPSSNYQSLQTELEKQLAQGVSYASPSEGENRSSIQLADLDNDGVGGHPVFPRRPLGDEQQIYGSCLPQAG